MKQLIAAAILLLLLQPVLADEVREETALHPEEDMRTIISEEQSDAGEIMTQ